MTTLYEELLAEIEADIWPADVDECVKWEHCRNHGGYGKVWNGDKQLRVHRVSYAASRWLDLDGIDDLVVMHRCHRPICYRPSHLKLGTQFDNMKDSVDSGRNHNVNVTHCPAGHIYDLENTRISPTGKRYCRTCQRRRAADRRANLTPAQRAAENAARRARRKLATSSSDTAVERGA